MVIFNLHQIKWLKVFFWDTWPGMVNSSKFQDSYALLDEEFPDFSLTKFNFPDNNNRPRASFNPL